MPLLTAKEAAAELRISVLTLRRHIGNGAIAVTVIGAGMKRPRYAIEADEGERFKKQNRRLHIKSESTRQSGRARARSSTTAVANDFENWLTQQAIEKRTTQGIQRPSRAKKKPPRSP